MRSCDFRKCIKIINLLHFLKGNSVHLFVLQLQKILVVISAHMNQTGQGEGQTRLNQERDIASHNNSSPNESRHLFASTCDPDLLHTHIPRSTTSQAFVTRTTFEITS